MAKKCRWPKKKKLTKTGAYNVLEHLRESGHLSQEDENLLEAYKCGAHWHLGRRTHRSARA